MKNAPVRHRLEYLPFLAVKRLLLTLPHTGVRRFGRGLGALWHSLDRRHRQIALDNLLRVFPDMSLEERRRIVAECYRHFGSAFCEAISAGRFTAEHIDRLFDIEGWEHVEAARVQGRGLLLMCGHLGSWQVAPYALGHLFGGVHVVARPPDNPHVARDINSLREHLGVQVIERGGSGHRIYRIVKKGGVLGMVIDQRVPDNTGIIVPFLGHPARSSSVPAFICLKTGAPAVPTVCLPAPNGRYRLVFRQAISGRGEGDEAVAEHTTRMLECIAEEIRLNPEQWLWMHRRWKL